MKSSAMLKVETQTTTPLEPKCHNCIGEQCDLHLDCQQYRDLQAIKQFKEAIRKVEETMKA